MLGLRSLHDRKLIPLSLNGTEGGPSAASNWKASMGIRNKAGFRSVGRLGVSITDYYTTREKKIRLDLDRLRALIFSENRAFGSLFSAYETVFFACQEI